MLAALECYAGFVDFKLEGVEGDCLDGFLDLEGDIDGAVVGPGSPDWMSEMEME